LGSVAETLQNVVQTSDAWNIHVQPSSDFSSHKWMILLMVKMSFENIEKYKVGKEHGQTKIHANFVLFWFSVEKK
jgi:hypothetical protein